MLNDWVRACQQIAHIPLPECFLFWVFGSHRCCSTKKRVRGLLAPIEESWVVAKKKLGTGESIGTLLDLSLISKISQLFFGTREMLFEAWPLYCISGLRWLMFQVYAGICTYSLALSVQFIFLRNSEILVLHLALSSAGYCALHDIVHTNVIFMILNNFDFYYCGNLNYNGDMVTVYWVRLYNNFLLRDLRCVVEWK